MTAAPAVLERNVDAAVTAGHVGVGVVVLSNTARSVDDLAGEVLRDLL